MKRFLIASCVALSLTGIVAWASQEMPEMPKPAKEHAWLEQIVGEWDATSKLYMVPGQPGMEATGSEKGRMIGPFWAQTEYTGSMMGMNITGVFTLGYSSEKKHYVGTWVDSFGEHLWTYQGKLDEAGKVLTMETKGPCTDGSGMCNYQESIELDGKDHKIFTSKVQGADGKWSTMITIDYKRKK